MQPLKLSYTPAALNATGLASAVAVSGSLTYALTATTMGDSMGHIVSITGLAATNHSGKTFTIVGTDSDGQPQKEGIAGPNGAVAVTSTLYFKTVTSVTVSATTGADTFNIGWTAAAISTLVPLNWRQVNYQTSLAIAITGTVNVTVQHCYDNALEENASKASWTWWNHATLVNIIASKDSNYAFPVTFTRVLINSVTAGATVAFFIVQGA